MDERTRASVSDIPLLTVRASPRDGAAWESRLKEELSSLIAYVRAGKAADRDWFRLAPDARGLRWSGVAWAYHGRVRYEFALEFELPAGYPAAPPELRLPQLEGKTAKMYRGGKICQTVHFVPLWARNAPRFGVAHSLALSLGPWLAAELPDLAERGVIDEFKK